MAFFASMSAIAALAAIPAASRKTVFTRRASARHGRDPACRAVAVRYRDGWPAEIASITSLYELVGARLGDDADELKNAFRRAVKANHPDLHPDDPYAPVRLSGIVRAYAILRDPQARAAYDDAIELERELLRPRPKRSFLRTLHNVIAEGVTIGALAIALSGGYVLLAGILGSNGVKMTGVPAPEPTKITAVQPTARTDVTERVEPQAEPAHATVLPGIANAPSVTPIAAEGNNSPGIADESPAQDSPKRDATKLADDSSFPADQVDTRTRVASSVTTIEVDSQVQQQILNPTPDAVLPGKVGLSPSENDKSTFRLSSPDYLASVTKNAVETPDQQQHLNPTPNAFLPGKVGLSSLENDKNTSKPSSPESPTSDQKQRLGTARARLLDVRTPKLSAHEKAQMAPTRQSSGRPPVKQASLDNKGTPACYESQSCSTRSSTLLGIGF